MDLKNEAAVTAMAQETQIDIRQPTQNDGRACDILVEDRDITWDIRSGNVEAYVSIVAAYAGVRKALTDQQRRIGLRGGVVMVGRDIGTVVLPEADLKVYMIASAEERARRRHTELTARGEESNYDEILSKMIERDRIDSTRAVAPLRPADDALILDTDNMNESQVYERIMELCK